MRTLLSERYAPITSSIGFLEVPLDTAASGLERWRQTRRQVTTVRPPEGFPDVLRRLEPLTSGVRPRELLVAAGTWTAYFDNFLHGPDAVSAIGHLSGALGCRGLAIRTTPRTVGLPGVRQGRAGAIQFELFGPVATDFLNYVRAVGVTNDGRKWEFDAAGAEQAFEETATYRSRRVRDRFTSDMLERYCQALGIDVFNPDSYGPRSVFFESAAEVPVGGLVMSLAEAQKWFEINPSMADSLPG